MEELDTIPSYGSTLKKRRVKNGGDIVYSNSIGLHALKGNRTLEFWRYVMPPAGQANTDKPGGYVGVSSNEGVGQAGSFLAVGPNPVPDGQAVLRYSVPVPGAASISVFDIGGRRVLDRELHLDRGGAEPLDLRSLRPGIYLARIYAAGTSADQKIVISR